MTITPTPSGHYIATYKGKEYLGYSHYEALSRALNDTM